MNVRICISHIHIYPVSYLSSVHIFFFKDILKETRCFLYSQADSLRSYSLSPDSWNGPSIIVIKVQGQVGKIFLQKQVCVCHIYSTQVKDSIIAAAGTDVLDIPCSFKG